MADVKNVERITAQLNQLKRSINSDKDATLEVIGLACSVAASKKEAMDAFIATNSTRVANVNGQQTAEWIKTGISFGIGWTDVYTAEASNACLSGVVEK